MKIKNKMESYEKIIKLNLNRFPEEVFRRGENKKINKFVDENHVEFYAIRSKDVIGYKTKIKVPRDLILEEVENHDLFSISVSSYNYNKSLILIGDIRIDKNNGIWLLASKTDYPYKFTNATPEYNLDTKIFDKELNYVLGFDSIYKYIVEKNLIDIIVEFAVYNEPVGILNEPIIIFELRTDY